MKIELTENEILWIYYVLSLTACTDIREAILKRDLMPRQKAEDLSDLHHPLWEKFYKYLEAQP